MKDKIQLNIISFSKKNIYVDNCFSSIYNNIVIIRESDTLEIRRFKFMKLSLKAARVNAELSLTETAKTLCVSTRTLHNYENYKTTPNIGTILAMSTLYECPVKMFRLYPKEERKE